MLNILLIKFSLKGQFFIWLRKLEQFFQIKSIRRALKTVDRLEILPVFYISYINSSQTSVVFLK